LAFALSTGARDGALATMKLKHVDLAVGSVFQDARDVQTKFSKTFVTYFFPVGEDVRQIIDEWVNHLRHVRLWGNDDPLFPATRVELGAKLHFEATGIERSAWKTAAPIRAIFKQAFEAAGLPYFNPHSFRSTLVQLGQLLCHTAEDFKAWSQNLGHEGVLTTFYSYGSVAPRRQGEIIRGLARPKVRRADTADELAAAVVRAMRKGGLTIG
jgi:integrase/recombinase XerD